RIELPLMVADMQVVAEDKQLVANDRAAEISAEVVIDGHRIRSGLEVVLGLQRADAIEFIGRAVKVVGAGFEDDIRHGSADPSELRLIVSGRDADALNRFAGRNENLQESRPFVVVYAFDLRVICQTRLAVDLGGK